jgi:ribonuclease E
VEGQPQPQQAQQAQQPQHQPRPEREGDEQRRGGRNRHRRDRQRGERGERPAEQRPLTELEAHKREEQLQREEGLRLAAQQAEEAPRSPDATIPPTPAVQAMAERVEEAPRSPEATIPPKPAPRAEPKPEPKIDAEEVLRDAGLVMIETDRSKAPEQQPLAEEPQQLGRPRRERARAEPQDEELKQVETKR